MWLCWQWHQIHIQIHYNCVCWIGTLSRIFKLHLKLPNDLGIFGIVSSYISVFFTNNFLCIYPLCFITHCLTYRNLKIRIIIALTDHQYHFFLYLECNECRMLFDDKESEFWKVSSFSSGFHRTMVKFCIRYEKDMHCFSFKKHLPKYLNMWYDTKHMVLMFHK